MTKVFVEMILPSCVEGSPSWSTRNRKNLSMFTPPDMQVVQVVVGSCSISFAEFSQIFAGFSLTADHSRDLARGIRDFAG